MVSSHRAAKAALLSFGMTFGLIELPLLGHDWVAFRRRGMRPG